MMIKIKKQLKGAIKTKMHYSIVKSPWLLVFFLIIIYGILYYMCIKTIYKYKVNIF